MRDHGGKARGASSSKQGWDEASVVPTPGKRTLVQNAALAAPTEAPAARSEPAEHLSATPQLPHSLIQRVFARRDVVPGPAKRTTAVQRLDTTSAQASPDPQTREAPALKAEGERNSSDALIEPEHVAEFVNRRPDLRDDVLEWAERAGGDAYVRQILKAIAEHGLAAPAEAMQVPAAPGTPAAPSGSVSRPTATPIPNASATSHQVEASSADMERDAPSAGWTPPADAKLEDPMLLELAGRVHHARLGRLMSDLGGVLALSKSLRATRSLETRYEVKGKDRTRMVDGIGAVRADLAAIADPSNPDVLRFTVAVNRKLEEIAPYHFQLNIPTIETSGGWSTCNITSLAMALEAIGKGATAYPAEEHSKLVAVARVFKNDIAQARLATDGTAPTITALEGLRLPDFLELAAVAEFLTSKDPGRDEIVGAATQAVTAKLKSSFLKQLARKFGAEAKDKPIQWDASKSAKQNRATVNALQDYGRQHRGDGSHGVEQLSTARNLAAKETDPAKKAAAVRRYEALLPAQQAALDGEPIEGDLSLETYRSAVTRELGPEIDAGHGVIAGLYMHWTRLYGIDGNHILVQDPGAWNRTEISVTWAEARAMGYFWTNIVIS